MTAMRLRAQLKRAVELLEKVISQTDRRVFRGEKVPASEKLVSYFEDPQEAQELPGRFRSEHLDAETRLRPGPLQLEELGRVQALTLEFDLRLQLAGDRQNQAGIS